MYIYTHTQPLLFWEGDKLPQRRAAAALNWDVHALVLPLFVFDSARLLSFRLCLLERPLLLGRPNNLWAEATMVLEGNLAGNC